MPEQNSRETNPVLFHDCIECVYSGKQKVARDGNVSVECKLREKGYRPV